MEPHSVELPRKILMGKGVSGRMLELCKELRIMERPLVLADPMTKKIAGDRILQDLKSLDARMEIVKEASVQEVARISMAAGPIGAVISVGGGSVIDTGKAISEKNKVDFICVPTAPSHDGIVSSTASLMDGKKKVSVKGRMPLAIVADITILKSAPKRLIASGYADAVSNITAVHDWKLAKKKEYYSEYAAELGLLAAKKAMRSASLIRDGTERGIRNLMEALITSSIAMTIAGSSRPASGAEHAISHVLDTEGSKALHGEQCGVACIVTACLQGQDWWKIREALKKGGAPVTAKELGIKRGKFLMAVVRAKNYRDRYTILNERDVDLKKAEKACKDTGVC